MGSSREIKNGFTYNSDSATGNVIICQQLRALILVVGDVPMQTGRIKIKEKKVWFNPNCQIWDSKLQSGLLFKQVEALAYNPVQKESTLVIYTTGTYKTEAEQNEELFNLSVALVNPSVTGIH